MACGCCGGGRCGDACARGGADVLRRTLVFLEAWPCVLVSGLCTLASFLFFDGACADHGAAHAFEWRNPALVAVLVSGFPMAAAALRALFLQKRITSALLISIAMVACLAIGQIFAAGEVAFIMALGGMLEELTLARAKRGLQKLVSLVPSVAHRIVTCPKCIAKGKLLDDVEVSELNVGDGIQVLPGETIPVDGEVFEGASSVDQSVMTGESLPVDKTAGDEVYSGTINRFGALKVRVTKAGADSSLQKLIGLVREAQARKAPMQRIADRWAAVLVPVSLTLAVLTGVGAWLILGNADVALIRGVTILVVFCPCALALATPTSIMAAIGQATKYGVIVKSGEALEKMGSVTVACFDKTGTLTTGRLGVAARTDDETLRLAAAVEQASEHPLAKAVCSAAGAVTPGTDFAMVPGRGVKGTVDGGTVVCGTEAWLAENGVVGIPFAETVGRLRGEGKAVILVARDGVARGYVALADTIRPGAAEALAGLSACGLSACLLTGDHRATAAFVARDLGIAEVRSELLPQDKATVIDGLQRSGRLCCMIGDGVNDAVALKTAYVGIAMGGAGSDIAVEAADIALVGDDLTKISYVKRLSDACVKLIKTNIAISMCINAAAIVCSMLGLLTPVTGALVHNAGSVLVVLNAALLYDRKFR